MSAISLAAKCKSGLNSKFCSIIGAQWGDEGKGKLVDILAPKYDYICRFNGGNNAGHTVVVNKKKYPFHLLPCGILYNQCKNLLGNGTVIHIPSLFDELKTLDVDNINYKGRLIISDRAHIVTDMHMFADAKRETGLKGFDKIK